MKITNESNVGWVILNGGGWNNHATAKALNEIAADAPDQLPAVPPGYAVLVAPISDKPMGLRCALVKALPRLTSPVVSFKNSDGQPISSRGIIDQSAYDDLASAEALLAAAGFVNHRRGDGVMAEVEMCDDGCDGDAYGWAAEVFGCEVEKIYSVYEEQQSEDSSSYFIREMAAQIEKIANAK